MQIKKVRILAILNFVIYTIAFLTSTLSQTGKIGNKNMGEVSDKYDALFTPAGITFSVWGVIYVSLFAFCTYHLLKSYKKPIGDEANQNLLNIGYLFTINNLAITAWVFAFLNEYMLVSVGLIIIQLICLVMIHINLNIYNPQAKTSTKIFTYFPLTIYLAWISIATVANISAWLISINFNGWGITAVYWTIIMICVATLISVFVILKMRNYWFVLVIIWALYGIILKRNEAGADEFASIINFARAGIISVCVAAIFQFYRNIKLVK